MKECVLHPAGKSCTSAQATHSPVFFASMNTFKLVDRWIDVNEWIDKKIDRIVVVEVLVAVVIVVVVLAVAVVVEVVVVAVPIILNHNFYSR